MINVRNILAFIVLMCTFMILSEKGYCSNLSDEKPFAEIYAKDGVSSMRLSTYMQARLEYGDLIVGNNEVVRGSEFDLYFRRLAFGAYGTAFYKNLKYGLSFSADQTPLNSAVPAYSENDGVALSDAYLQYFYDDANFIKVGKGKFPLSRVYLTSSTKQLFAERPYYVYGWGDVLKEYAGTNISMGGKLFEKSLSYNFSISKAWRYGDILHADSEEKVLTSTPFYVARIDWSPQGWIEKELSDTHLGEGKHINLGSYVAYQGINYSVPSGILGAEGRWLYGINLSSNIDNLTIQTEFNSTRIDSPTLRENSSTNGWLLQGGYYFPESMLEPVIRYEVFNSDIEQPQAAVQSITVGINKYIKGNSLKIGANYEYSRYDRNFTLLRPEEKSDKGVFRTTLQFIF